jgi:hypothetical protein
VTDAEREQGNVPPIAFARALAAAMNGGKSP